MLMTTAAICATREVSWWPSYYRGEQYDPDLGLYYLRARYYNPATGRFMSRDPLEGDPTGPASLHKYLYANGDPTNRIDPRGMEAGEEEAKEEAIVFGSAKTVFRIAVWVVNIECAAAAVTEAVTKGKHWNDNIPLAFDILCLSTAGYGITTEGYALLMTALE
jgi:RHS repeat-associated protein